MQMSSIKIITRVLNLHSGKSNLVKGILGPLSRGHHQIGVTVNAVPSSNSQAGSLAPSGSFSIRQSVRLGLVNYPQKGLPFTCDVSRSRTFSSATEDTKPEKTPKSEQRKIMNKGYILNMRQTAQEVQRVEAELKELVETGIKIDHPIVVSMVTEFFCRQGNLEKAFHYKALLADFPDFLIRDSTRVNLATLLASDGQFEEAEKLMSEHSAHSTIEGKKAGISNSIYKLLGAIGSSGDIKRVRGMLDLLLKKGYYSGNPPNEHLGTLIKFHLAKNDIDSAVAELMETIKKYKSTPCLNLILQTLIEKSETDRLQKVVDAATEVHGEPSVLMDLASVFLQLNNLTKTFEILKSFVVRIPESQLNTMLENLVLNGKIETLEEFVKQSKDFADVNRDLIYYHLFKAYVLEKNLEKVLEAWSKMQEEGVKPSRYTMHLLGHFLTQNEQPVSFQFRKTIGPYTFSNTKVKDLAEKAAP